MADPRAMIKITIVLDDAGRITVKTQHVPEVNVEALPVLQLGMLGAAIKSFEGRTYPLEGGGK